MITNIELIKRIEKFMSELGVPMTAFCRNLKLSASSITKWKQGHLQLSESTMQRIDEYLRKYGF